MKSFYKRIISGALTFVILFFVCVPTASASDTGSLDTPARGDFWAWVQMKDNAFKSIFDKDICPKSPNINGRHEFVKTHTTVDGKTGYYYICKHCGKSAGEVGEEAYQQQVSDLPATGYNSAGRLVWQPSFEDMSYDSSGFAYFRYGSMSCYPRLDALSVYGVEAFPGGFFFRKSSDASSFRYETKFELPLSGSYCLISNVNVRCSFVGSDGVIYKAESLDVSSVGFKHYAANSLLSYSSVDCRLSTNVAPSGISVTYMTANVKFPAYEVIPDTAISGDTYNITTRPTVIDGGNYGIVGDNGQITTITNTTQIINEGDNIYYNPATGQTYTITDWTYNYDGRIYNITLDTGDTVSVEYGDENITIVENNVVEGDTIVNNYTIYYMIDGSGSGDNPDPTPGPTACPHEWYKTGERQATCLIPAQRTYTCSICGEQTC